jgi:predicted lipid-binding transport protein (Tim44 family)
LVSLHDARIVASSLHGRLAEITVAFSAEFAGGTVNDVWTFERNLDSSDPNWLLVATSGDVPE